MNDIEIGDRVRVWDESLNRWVSGWRVEGFEDGRRTVLLSRPDDYQTRERFVDSIGEAMGRATVRVYAAHVERA